MSSGKKVKSNMPGKGEPQAPRLTVIKGKATGKVFTVTKDETSLGRSPECDIHIDDNNISRKHARVVFLSGIFFIYDNESLNGTFVNGKKMIEAQLQSGDMIRVGDTQLKFEYEKIGHKAAPPKKLQQSPKPSAKIASKRPVPRESKTTPRVRLYLWALIIAGGAIAILLVQKGKRTETVRPGPKPSVVITPYSFKVDEPPPKVPEQIKESDPTALYSQGLISMMSENYKEAIDLFKKTLILDPNHESAKINLEKSRKLLKKTIEDLYASGVREYDILYYDRAILQWKKVLTLARGFDRAMYKKARERIAEANKRLKGK